MWENYNKSRSHKDKLLCLNYWLKSLLTLAQAGNSLRITAACHHSKSISGSNIGAKLSSFLLYLLQLSHTWPKVMSVVVKDTSMGSHTPSRDALIDK